MTTTAAQTGFMSWILGIVFTGSCGFCQSTISYSNRLTDGILTSYFLEEINEPEEIIRVFSDNDCGS